MSRPKAPKLRRIAPVALAVTLFCGCKDRSLSGPDASVDYRPQNSLDRRAAVELVSQRVKDAGLVLASYPIPLPPVDEVDELRTLAASADELRTLAADAAPAPVGAGALAGELPGAGRLPGDLAC